MNDLSRPTGSHAWQTPGEIYEWLQQEQYQVHTIEFDGRWYLVQGLDPEGKQIEMKVNPQPPDLQVFSLGVSVLGLTAPRAHPPPHPPPRDQPISFSIPLRI